VQRHKPSLQAGYSLVQLSVVILIIGLLTAGTLYGGRMIDNSKITATWVQAQAVKAAFNNFKSRYEAFPGDMLNAVGRLPGCDNSPFDTCMNGNGDGIIGRADQSYNTDLTPAQDQENTLFWYHLAAADMYGSVDLDRPSNVLPQWISPAPYRGGFIVKSFGGFLTAGPLATGQNLRGIYLINTSGAAYSQNLPDPILRADQAQVFDQKFDDGRPGFGVVKAYGPVDDTLCRSSETEYAVTQSENTCNIMIEINAEVGQ
jgi:type II secretory pathway pseudopilin PulG